MTMTHRIKYLQECPLDALTACDLRKEARSDIPSAGKAVAYRVTVAREGEPEDSQEAEAAEMLWYPEIGRGGVAWGADATWTDADGPEDCAERVLVTGELAF